MGPLDKRGWGWIHALPGSPGQVGPLAAQQVSWTLGVHPSVGRQRPLGSRRPPPPHPWGDQGPFLSCSMSDPMPACRFCTRPHYSPGAKLHLGSQERKGHQKSAPAPAPPPGSPRGTQPPVSRQKPRTPRSPLPMGPSHLSKHPQSVPQPHPLSRGPTMPPCCLYPTL